MKQTLLFILSIALCTLNMTAQTAQRLSATCNYFRAGDKIIKQQVEYKDPGASGKHICWDFSMLQALNEKYRVLYYSKTKGDTVNMIGNEHQTIYRYSLLNDTLWLTGYENRTTQMKFEHPEAQLRFPFRYGGSLRSEFSGKGLYCLKEKLIAKGITTATVDGLGMLITPKYDTLQNVLRVKRLREYTQIGIDSVRMQLETYSWYAKGYRYPVFETYKSMVLRGDSTTESFKTSFYYPVEELRKLPDDPANIAEQQTSTGGIEAVFTQARYLPNPVIDNLYIDYKLTRNARVWFSLHNNSGIPHYSSTPQSLTEGTHSATIPMNRLMTGTYLLNVHVDEMMMKQVIIKL